MPTDGGSPPAWPPGGGETGALVRAIDWSATPLGPMRAWPQGLRTIVGLMLGSHQPMFIAWGPERTMLYNDGYAPLCGAKHPWALGRPFAQVWADVIDVIGPIMDRTYAGESVHMSDIALTMRDRRGYAEEAHFSFSYTPVRDEQGCVAGVFCACSETTAQVLMERENARLLALNRDRARQLQQMFEQAPGFMAVLHGPEHRFEMANEAYRRLTGQRELIGMTVRQALPEVEGQGFLELLDRVHATGEPFIGRGVRVALQRAPGEPLAEAYLDFIYQPLTEADGSVRGIFVQGHDVTEQHRLVLALQQADRLKDEFLAMLAHELRNPLAPLTNALRLIGHGEPMSGRGRDALAMAQRQTRQLKRLVDDLLEVGRITRGQIELRCEPMMVATAVRNAAESVAAAIGQRHQELRIEVPIVPSQIRADPARIAQVLENLLTNANKYTPEGGAIRVEVRDRPDEVEIRVADNGIGIEPDKLEHVFELFTQVEASIDRAQGGLGIGLALVKRLVELHGGSVAATSPGRGRGSTFIVRLPHDGPGSADDAR